MTSLSNKLDVSCGEAVGCRVLVVDISSGAEMGFYIGFDIDSGIAATEK